MAGSRQIVLCFDGTENTFTTNGPETNVLKICRMLERTDEQCKSSEFPGRSGTNRIAFSMLLPTYEIPPRRHSPILTV